MNRIGIQIKEARLKAKLAEKELAQKCGATENYIMQVKSGKKVMNEKIAEKIFSVLGKKIDSLIKMEKNYEIEESSLKAANTEKKEYKKHYELEPTEQWQDVLANIIKRFPIYDVASNKIMGYKDLPIIHKKIEGYYWDKIMFVRASNDSLVVLRIHPSDVIMVCMTKEIKNKHIYITVYKGKRMLAQI